MKMKKLSIILLLSALTLFTVSAQNPPENRRTQLNVGVGFSNWGIPLYIGLDFGVHPDISLGLESSFRSYNQNYTGIGYRSSIIGFSGNGNYHFNRILEIPSNWDFYAGLNIGYFVWSTPSDYPGTGSSGLGLGAQIGGRYLITNNFGLNLEIGGGNAFSGGKFGITYIF
jgi:outer membrane immunogenic protein